MYFVVFYFFIFFNFISSYYISFNFSSFYFLFHFCFVQAFKGQGNEKLVLSLADLDYLLSLEPSNNAARMERTKVAVLVRNYEKNNKNDKNGNVNVLNKNDLMESIGNVEKKNSDSSNSKNEVKNDGSAIPSKPFDQKDFTERSSRRIVSSTDNNSNSGSNNSNNNNSNSDDSSTNNGSIGDSNSSFIDILPSPPSSTSLPPPPPTPATTSTATPAPTPTSTSASDILIKNDVKEINSNVLKEMKVKKEKETVVPLDVPKTMYELER